ncbi:MAG: hypothetical protein J6Q85_05050 [Clostridia bacterium]|nr:hypothetical protein [Clostridia bacterium]
MLLLFYDGEKEDTDAALQSAGFAFKPKPSVSSLTSGAAKNLRAMHEYPFL